MKRHALFLALAVMGLAVSAPTLAQSSGRKDEVKALKALVEKQQKQLDQQQQDLQALRASVARLEGQQSQQQSQIQAQAQEQAQAVVQAAPKQAPASFTSGPGIAVAFHGFVDATTFSQTKNFVYGNGQNAEYPVAGAKGTLSGFDIRNTRFWFDLTGAKVAGNWTGGARLEMDFFGGNNGTGAYSQQQPLPRMRQAYMVLDNPVTGSNVKIGQQWDLIFPLDNVPTSLSHIAFPLGYGTGMIGWRFPGAVWSQDLNHGSSGPAWRLDVGAFEGAWNGPGSTVNYLTAANAGFRPQIEARLHVQEDKNWMFFASAHYSEINLAGVGNTEPTPIKRTFSSEAFELGGYWMPGAWVFRSSIYTGKGIGEIFGDLSQFGDIKDSGGYASAGYRFTPNWSANVFYSMSKPNAGDVIRWLGHGSTGLLKARQAAADVEYTVGDYAFALEWIHAVLNSTPNGVERVSTSGNQFNLSAYYHF